MGLSHRAGRGAALRLWLRAPASLQADYTNRPIKPKLLHLGVALPLRAGDAARAALQPLQRLVALARGEGREAIALGGIDGPGGQRVVEAAAALVEFLANAKLRVEPRAQLGNLGRGPLPARVGRALLGRLLLVETAEQRLALGGVDLLDNRVRRFWDRIKPDVGRPSALRSIHDVLNERPPEKKRRAGT